MNTAEPGEEDATTAEQVGGPAAEQQQAAEDERVARDRPAEVAAGDVEVRGEVGQRDVHGRDVEDDHELRERQQEQQAMPALLRVPGTVAVGIGVRLRLVAMAMAGEAELVRAGSVHGLPISRTQTVVSGL